MARKPAPKDVKSKKAELKKAGFEKWLPLLVIIFTFLLYSPSLNYQFTGNDDTNLTVENQSFLSQPASLFKAFTQSCFEVPGEPDKARLYYRPILIDSFVIDLIISGGHISAFTFHFMNLIYHLLAVFLLFLFLRKIGCTPVIASFFSLLFAVHPVNNYVVCWIPGRNESLLAIFTLLSLITLINYYEKGKFKDILLHFLCLAIALFCKESGVVIIFMGILYIGLWKNDVEFFKRKYFIPVVYGLIAVGWLSIRMSVLGWHQNIAGTSLADNIVKALPNILLYIGKIALPFNLNVYPSVTGTGIIMGIISFVILTYLITLIPGIKLKLFTISWFFLFLIPALIIAKIPPYEHRDYLPMMGLIIGFSQIPYVRKNQHSLKKELMYVFVGLALLFSVITYLRTHVYSGKVSYWADGTTGNSKDNTAKCYVELTRAYVEEFSKDKKPETLQKVGDAAMNALKWDSTTQGANCNYGSYLCMTNRQDLALPYFLNEIKYHPDYPSAYDNAAMWYYMKGNKELSEKYEQKGKELKAGR